MRKTLDVFLFAMVVFGLFPQGSAAAHPAPMLPQQLYEQADLVLDAECIEVGCIGVVEEDDLKRTVGYLSILEPGEVQKGVAPAQIRIRGTHTEWKEYEQTGGSHEFPIPLGWAGTLHLRDLGDGFYADVWWNGRVEDPDSSHPAPLPDCGLGMVEAYRHDHLVPLPASASSPMPMFPISKPGGAVEQPASKGEESRKGGCSFSATATPGAGVSLLALTVLVMLLARKRRTRREVSGAALRTA